MARRLALILILTLLAAPLAAQRFTASIRGTVTDPNGDALPGATVNLEGTETGLNRTTFTNASGIYTFGDLPVGAYEITFTLDGFKASVVSDIALHVADVREVSAALELGDVSETITVESEAIAVDTLSGEVSGLVSGEQIRELPLNGRNFVQLTLLQPGVSAPEGFDTKNKGLLAGVDLSISGSGTTGNMWTVDGANNNDVGSNRTILIYPSVDAIEEFKIHSNSYSAEFGGAGGGQINIVTRGGTNQLRGSAFMFMRDDSWNETNYFLEQAGLDTEPLDRQDYGFTLGGPIKQDKLHFFLSGEWNQEERGIARSGFVPTAAERAGDFTGPSIPGCTPAIPTDPTTGQPFPGNVIPGDRINAGGQAMLNLYPLPNVTPVAGSCNNWVEAVVTPIDWEQANLRLDYDATDRTRLMLRYTQDTWLNGAPNAGEANGLWGDDPYPAVDTNWDQPGHSLVAQLSQTIGDDSVNTVTFSYSGNEISLSRGGTNPGLNSQINAAIPAAFGGKTGGADRSHPVFWGAAGYGALWNIAPWENKQDLMVLKDDYSQVFGKHWLKVGALYSQNKKKEYIGGSSASETPQFWGPSTGHNGWGANTGNLLADFLLQDMTFGYAENSHQPDPELNWEDVEFYIADTWQANPRLSVDYGVRYSNYKWPYASDNLLTTFVPELFDPALGGDPCNGLAQVPGTDPCGDAGLLGGSTGPGRGLVDSDTDNFAPRLGMAYDLFGNGRSVVRAGFGQFFQRDRVNIQLEFAGNPPFRSSINGIRKLDEPPEACADCGLGRPMSGIAPDFQTPYNLQFNVAWEQRLGRSSTIEVAYVGSRGRHLTRRSDINQVASGDNNGNGIPDRLEYVTAPEGDGGAGVRGALRPYAVFGDANILFWESNGLSEYDSLQTQFVHRYGTGSQFQASYTLASFKANDPLNDAGAGLSASAITDRENPDLDFGNAGLHRDHVFSANVIHNLPRLENQSSLVRGLFGAWQLSGIAQYSSGQALTVRTGNLTGVNGAGGTGYTENMRPLLTGASCSGSGLQVINPDAFTLVGWQLGTLSGTRPGQCEGADFFQVDFSLTKNIRITDRVTGQFRFEVFNVTNRDNFVGINSVMNPSSVTYDSENAAERTTITGYTLPANFGEAQAARDPRQIQIGFKLLF